MKKNISQIAAKFSKSRKILESPKKGKGKRKLILQERLEDEDKLHAIETDILIDAAKNKVSVEEQFKLFIE